MTLVPKRCLGGSAALPCRRRRGPQHSRPRQARWGRHQGQRSPPPARQEVLAAWSPAYEGGVTLVPKRCLGGSAALPCRRRRGPQHSRPGQARWGRHQGQRSPPPARQEVLAAWLPHYEGGVTVMMWWSVAGSGADSGCDGLCAFAVICRFGVPAVGAHRPLWRRRQHRFRPPPGVPAAQSPFAAWLPHYEGGVTLVLGGRDPACRESIENDSSLRCCPRERPVNCEFWLVRWRDRRRGWRGHRVPPSRFPRTASPTRTPVQL